MYYSAVIKMLKRSKKNVSSAVEEVLLRTNNYMLKNGYEDS